MEIERKFLVNSPTGSLSSCERHRIRQGYVGVTTQEHLSVRLRRQDEQHFITIKGPGVLARQEWEVEVSAEQFEALWPATEGRRLEKTRYVIPREKGHPIELDLFGTPVEGLMLAEVEFDSEAEAERFSPPSWFGAEVSSDPAYRNRSLAMKGRR